MSGSAVTKQSRFIAVMMSLQRMLRWSKVHKCGELCCIPYVTSSMVTPLVTPKSETAHEIFGMTINLWKECLWHNVMMSAQDSNLEGSMLNGVRMAYNNDHTSYKSKFRHEPLAKNNSPHRLTDSTIHPKPPQTVCIAIMTLN